MNFDDVSTAVDSLGEDVARIRHKANPTHDYFAKVEYCRFNEKLGRGFIYLSWFDPRIMAFYAETLTRVDVRCLISIERSAITEDDQQVAYLHDDWEAKTDDRFVFPGPWEGLQDS